MDSFLTQHSDWFLQPTRIMTQTHLLPWTSQSLSCSACVHWVRGYVGRRTVMECIFFHSSTFYPIEQSPQ